MNFIYNKVNVRLEDLELEADKVREEKLELQNKLKASQDQLSCCKMDNEKRMAAMQNKG